MYVYIQYVQAYQNHASQNITIQFVFVGIIALSSLINSAVHSFAGFDCRCGNVFCALHRYADKHNCSFDYKTAGREELERKHPKVVAEKIKKL